MDETKIPNLKTVRIDPTIYGAIKKLCDENGIKYKRYIELVLKKHLDGVYKGVKK
jgi:predicted DNA binding CopG/RHH family protein